ncbi:hypothetical protein Mycsm_00866 [Mycobacterium sp. JS623]|uniref:hypothetical protein n=1 Tax=Mycobacterium sp. JS623 TaxID=212767 RepID=UPI0002A57276|nr:hypothetical protein [Mycobacterium sp. JS623]AGB21296.1 hypothetical protein Mycsm_00866 [Mycobacterium sp. JS623]
MGDKQRARKAKQARRDERRAKKRKAGASVETTFSDAIRRALVGHPLSLLSVASMIINVAKPESLLSPNSARPDPDLLERVLTGLIGVRNRETTALLAVVTELLVEEPATQLRCRLELAERGEHLPRWISALPEVDVYRAVRRTNVFGDVDELVIGMRLDGGHELTIAVGIDHNLWSSVGYAGAVPESIDDVLTQLAEMSSDTTVSEMNLADARVWIEDALDEPTFTPETETWPLYRALVQWLVSRLPEGGEHRSPVEGWKSNRELCDRFFATTSATPFGDPGHRQLLLELFETGSGDPFRWSAARVERAIRGAYYGEDFIPLEVALDAPDLLRAFIPYAHARSGIRDELTSRTLAMVDALRLSYKREVLRHASRNSSVIIGTFRATR